MEPDTVLQTRYRLEVLLGEGTSAAVWRALDLETGQVRAVKVLKPGTDENLRARFRAEARALMALRHPHVLRVHAVCTDDPPWIVADLWEETLFQRVKRKGRLPPSEAVPILLQALAGLAAAHEAGIVHRDVKPSNVLLRSDGAACVSDFGVARLGGPLDPRLTVTGTQIGSLGYMSPEQRTDAKRVGPASDVFGVAGVLYFALVRAHPSDLYMMTGQEPVLAPVPPPLRRVILRASTYEPGARYPDARSLCLALLEAWRAVEDVKHIGPTWDPLRLPGAAEVVEDGG